MREGDGGPHRGWREERDAGRSQRWRCRPERDVPGGRRGRCLRRPTRELRLKRRPRMGKRIGGKEESLPPVLSGQNSPWPTPIRCHGLVCRHRRGRGVPKSGRCRVLGGAVEEGSHDVMGKGGERIRMGGKGRGGVGRRGRGRGRAARGRAARGGGHRIRDE